jgi:hypothetical protein
LPAANSADAGFAHMEIAAIAATAQQAIFISMTRRWTRDSFIKSHSAKQRAR